MYHLCTDIGNWFFQRPSLPAPGILTNNHIPWSESNFHAHIISILCNFIYVCIKNSRSFARVVHKLPVDYSRTAAVLTAIASKLLVIAPALLNNLYCNNSVT